MENGSNMYVYIYIYPENFEKNAAIWCILKCILIRFQGKNSSKISATTTKKVTSLLGKRGVATGHAHPENFEKKLQFGTF